MILKSKIPLTARDRESYAHSVAAILNWRVDHSQIPYKPNISDDYYFTVDEPNNWKIKFYDDNQTFEIVHRYSGRDEKINEEILILSEWLAIRFNLEKTP